MLYVFLLPVLIVGLLALPVVYAIKKKKSFKRAIIGNVCTFLGVMVMCTVAAPFAMDAYAEAAAPAAATAEAEEAASDNGMAYLAAALAVGLGSIGGGIAVAAAAPAAIGAVSEDPKSFSKALIFVALGEGCALYGFIVALLMIFI
ncbi:MAG: ATPase [Oscillospiraceae bacterium]|nr:ATPase [Oscillospiraceae bacterium]